jgi:RHS repeat-associated protein
VAASAATPQRVDAAALGMGAFATLPATNDAAHHQLVVTPALGTPSGSMTFNTTGPIAYFGKPDIFNADLSAGALSAGVPIDVPAGPGGLTPPVSLAYSSAGVSENHSVQAAASWVGEGWSLGMGSINWSERDGTAGCVAAGTCQAVWEDQWQLSDPYGTGSELIPPNLGVSTFYDDTTNTYYNGTYHNVPAVWHTASESYAKVVDYVGPVSVGENAKPACFRVWLKNGLMEEFGCTSDSLLTYETSPGGVAQSYASGWLLDLVTDPQGNQIHFTYQRDTESQSGISYPRDAVLATIEWDSPNCRNAQTRCTGSGWAPLLRVAFAAGHAPTRLTNTPSGCNTGTNLRCDDPKDLSGSGGLTAPAVQGTFVLNDLDVQARGSGTAGWQTLKDYQFSYEQTGPGSLTDAATGKAQSTAGYLDLTQVTVVGDDGATALPTRSFGYTTVPEFYEDDTYRPNPATNCGPSDGSMAWNTGSTYDGNQCVLWSESAAGNSRYLATASNGLGLAQSFAWGNARNNTHGVTSGGSPADPLYCDSHLTGYPCDEADDQAWSHAALTSESASVVRAASGGNQTITSTTAYTYQLTTNFAGKECGDCSQGMYWGNENENDYLDYYNGKFMGFAQVGVSHPDGALDVHTFDATTGWGVYDNTQITGCAPNMQPPGPTPCPDAPWWNLTNAAHGHETELDRYDTNGTTLLSKTTTQYQAVCPPTGVSGSGSLTGYGNFGGNLVSELDHSNPVAACDVRPTRSDTTTEDGSSASGVPDQTTTYGYSFSGIYPSADTATTTSNDGGAPGSPTTSIAMTADIWNDAITTSQTGATGTYLVAVPAYTAIETPGDTAREQCTERGYDGHAYTAGARTTLTGGLLTTRSDFATGCGNSGNGWAATGPLTTTSTYDAYGNPITSDDADANAGVSGHTGCTNGSSQTLYSACDGFDLTFGALPIWHKNARNQITYTGYNATTDATGGYGLWPTSTRDFNGQTTAYGYDALGRMTSETLPGEGAGLTTASWSYTDWCSGTAAQTPCVEVDQTQRLDGATTVVSRAFYDGYGNLVETRAAAPGGQDVVRYRNYDVAGRPIFDSNAYFVAAYTGAPGAAAFAVPDSTQVGTSTAYDGQGRVLSVTDALSDATTTTYAIVCNAAGTGDAACYEQTLVTDPLGHRAGGLIDALGRKNYNQRYTGNSTATYAVYATTKYTYDYDGNLTRILHPDGTTTTSFAYDLAGRKTGMTDPDIGTTSYSYDADGNVTQSVDARGAAGTVYVGYDGLDRAIWRNTTNSPSGAYEAFTYDSTASGNQGVGRLTGETFTGGPNNTLSGSYSYVYDIRGQETSGTLTIGGTAYTVGTGFDDAGNILSQTYPDGEIVSTGYTAQGWLSGLSTQQGGTTTTLLSNVSYTGTGGAAHQVTGASLGGGTYSYAATYDALARATDTKLSRASDGVTLFEQTRTLDAAGNTTASGTTLPAGTDAQAYCYDEQDRLTWATSATATGPCGAGNTAGTLTSAAYTQSFAYDTMGRLTSGPLGAYGYGDAAHVHAATAIGGTWTASYDAAGDMTCRAPTSSTTCAGTPTGAPLTYDAEGMLVAWQNTPTSPTTTIGDLYDGQGDRVEQQVTQNGTTTATVYIGNLEEIATTGSTTTTTTYYYAGTARVALAVNGTVSYLASDALGTVEVALDASGTTTAATLDAPYGGTRYNSGTMPTDYGYTGQHSDAATGLDYYVSRFYDPLAGQFTSPDTTLPGNGYDLWGLSRYAYVEGDPVGRADPTGHCPMCIGFVVGAVIGGAIEYGTQVYGNYQKGDPSPWTDVNMLQVGEAALVGGVIGATGGLAGAAVGSALAETGAAVEIGGGIAAGAALGAGEGAAGQVGDNLIHGRHWSDDVGQAALFGAVTGGVGGGAGAVLRRYGGRILAAGGRLLGDACGGESFTPGTPVVTPAGKKPIAALKAGDQVVAYDPATGTATARTVRAVLVHHDHDLLDVTLRVAAPARGATGAVHAAPARNEVVHTTNYHPWLTADHGWLPASFLRLGEPVRRADGTTATVVAIRAVPGAAPMWDLTVDDLHDFTVGAGEYVVHNTDCLPTDGDPTARRVTLRRSTKIAIQRAMRHTPDGDYIDPNTGETIPRDGPFDYGHRPGLEWWRTRVRAVIERWTRQQVIEFENDPSHYQVEDPATNRSHRFEEPR